MPVGVTGRSQERVARLKGRIGCDADGWRKKGSGLFFLPLKLAGAGILLEKES